MSASPKPSDKKASVIKERFGSRLRALREKRGLSQQDLSHASTVSKVFLGTLERGEKAATIETIEKLADGLGVQPAELFQFDARASESDPAEKLGRKVAALARGSSEARIFRFETVARMFFEPESDIPKKPRAKRKTRKRRKDSKP